MLAAALLGVDLVFSRGVFTIWHVLTTLWYEDNF